MHPQMCEECLGSCCRAPLEMKPLRERPNFTSRRHCLLKRCTHAPNGALSRTDSVIILDVPCTEGTSRLQGAFASWRCLRRPGEKQDTQCPSLKYAFGHVAAAGIRAPLRGNGRAPAESEKHLYRKILSVAEGHMNAFGSGVSYVSKGGRSSGL